MNAAGESPPSAVGRATTLCRILIEMCCAAATESGHRVWSAMWSSRKLLIVILSTVGSPAGDAPVLADAASAVSRATIESASAGSSRDRPGRQARSRQPALSTPATAGCRHRPAMRSVNRLPMRGICRIETEFPDWRWAIRTRPLSDTAEATGSKPVQCQFESDRGHQSHPSTRPSTRRSTMRAPTPAPHSPGQRRFVDSDDDLDLTVAHSPDPEQSVEKLVGAEVGVRRPASDPVPCTGRRNRHRRRR